MRRTLKRTGEWAGHEPGNGPGRRQTAPGDYARHMSERRYAPAVATVQIDNDFTRVTEWRFPPGTETGMHVHEMEYVVVPTTTGTLTVITPEETFANTLLPGASYTRPKGSEHNVRNDSDAECAFVEIEFK